MQGQINLKQRNYNIVITHIYIPNNTHVFKYLYNLCYSIDMYTYKAYNSTYVK